MCTKHLKYDLVLRKYCAIIRRLFIKIEKYYDNVKVCGTP